MVKDQEYLSEKASYCIDLAKKMGATDASVTIGHSISETVNFRNKSLEASDRSDGLALSIETYLGKKKSSISPGNLKKHYSTLKPIRMNAKRILKNEGLLNFGNNKLKSKIINLNLSNKKNLNEAAKNFYHYLHKLDQSRCKKIAVVEIPDKGLGKTIND